MCQENLEDWAEVVHEKEEPLSNVPLDLLTAAERCMNKNYMWIRTWYGSDEVDRGKADLDYKRLVHQVFFEIDDGYHEHFRDVIFDSKDEFDAEQSAGIEVPLNWLLETPDWLLNALGHNPDVVSRVSSSYDWSLWDKEEDEERNKAQEVLVFVADR